MNQEITVSVIIVNWNGKQYLDKCLLSLKNQTYPFMEIIAVDNGSSDGSVEFIQKTFPEVRILKNKTNLGFAHSNNLGIISAKGKYIATLNNDTIADPGWIENLVKAAESRKDAGMFASKILSWNNPNLIESKGMLIYQDGIAKCRGYLTKDNGMLNAEEEILLPSACAALYKKDALFSAGLFDKDYFAYCEDVDLGLRIRLLGLNCIYVPNAKVCHYYSGTSRKNLLFKVYLAERNRIWTIIKIFPVSQVILSPIYSLKRYLFFIYAAMQERSPVKEFCKRESGLMILYVVFKAYVSTILNLTNLIRKRLHARKGNKAKDREMISWLRNYGVGAKELTRL